MVCLQKKQQKTTIFSHSKTESTAPVLPVGEFCSSGPVEVKAAEVPPAGPKEAPKVQNEEPLGWQRPSFVCLFVFGVLRFLWVFVCYRFGCCFLLVFFLVSWFLFVVLCFLPYSRSPYFPRLQNVHHAAEHFVPFLKVVICHLFSKP